MSWHSVGRRRRRLRAEVRGRTRAVPGSRIAAARCRATAPRDPHAAGGRARAGSRSRGSGWGRGTSRRGPPCPGAGLHAHAHVAVPGGPTDPLLTASAASRARGRARGAHDGLDPHRAELELGDLADRSSSSIVSTLAAASRKWKGMKQVPASRGARHGRAADAAAARGDAHEVAVRDAQPVRVVGVELHVRLGLDRVQRKQRRVIEPGVPVLQQPAGVEHERVTRRRQLLRRRPLGRARGAPCRRRWRSARRTAPPCRRSAPGPGG